MSGYSETHSLSSLKNTNQPKQLQINYNKSFILFLTLSTLRVVSSSQKVIFMAFARKESMEKRNTFRKDFMVFLLSSTQPFLNHMIKGLWHFSQKRNALTLNQIRTSNKPKIIYLILLNKSLLSRIVLKALKKNLLMNMFKELNKVITRNSFRYIYILYSHLDILR